ncbi:transmembrane protein 104 homolog isoform X2 [Arctopsyche grandis]|uniref:transmembrane protein 104 homolog isoform X2 n=1 Tax=Arctopsyche grandis TaxID=121162 RepID=UPI00406D6309
MPSETGARYSMLVGLVFIFNIIVGTGALTLPGAFSKAGWLLGTISIIFLAFMSFITATYVIECMACANAIIKWRNSGLANSPFVSEESADENTPINQDRPDRNANEIERLISTVSSRYYALDNRVELGEMAVLFFSRFGKVAFYVTMIVYLFGDLSIYSAAVAKSAMDVICSESANLSRTSFPDNSDCFNHNIRHSSFTRLDCYRVALVTFLMVLGPFVFFNVQKTKYLQMITTVMRWLAFIIMISLAFRMLIINGVKGKPPVFDMAGIPALFGACVYSFMCHHSLPGMIAPITSKKSIGSYLSLDFILIGTFYLLLALTGIFAFTHLEDLYTLNFIPTKGDGAVLQMTEYFLALFPVFTLSTSFPVMAITLRNTIQGVFLDVSRLDSYNLFLRKLLFPILTVIPPILITMFFEDISILVSFTGSFAGAGIQYVIPTFLVLCARKECAEVFALNVSNPYESPFKNRYWAFFVLAWSVICVVMVSVNMIQKHPAQLLF